MNFYQLGYAIAAVLSQPPTFSPVEFSSKSRKQCKSGYGCGWTCISTKKKCRVAVTGEAKNFAEYVKKNKNRLSEIQRKKAQEQKTAMIKSGVSPKGESIQEKLQEKIKSLQKEAKNKPTKSPTTIAPVAGNIGDFPVDQIQADPKRFQYKILGQLTKSGSVGSLGDVQKWDKNLAGIVQVWNDPADGKTYVINGHNRLSKAKELGVKEVTVRFIDAPDAASARAIGALTNIAEGRGTPLDAAKFMRDTGLTSKDMIDKGIPMRDKVADEGAALAGLSDKIFNKAIQGEITLDKAVVIGKSGLKPDSDQDALFDLIEKKKQITPEVLNELIDIVRSSSSRTTSQMTLFGAEEITESLAIEKAQVQSNLRERLLKDKRLFSVVGKSVNARQLERGGNIIDVEKSSEISQAASQGLRFFDDFKNISGPLSKMINEAAERIAKGESATKVNKDVYDRMASKIPNWIKGDFDE